MRFFDFLGADFLATPVDQVLLATLHHVVARRKPPHQVATAVEAIRGKGLRVVLRRAEIPAQGVRPARQHLADLAVGHIAVVLVDDAHLVICTDGPPDRLHPQFGRIVEPYEHEQPFGHADVLLHHTAWEDLEGAQTPIGLKSLSAALDDSHGRQVVLRPRRVMYPADEQRRHDVNVGDSVLLVCSQAAGRAARWLDNGS
jgi:hypothetical protein